MKFKLPENRLLVDFEVTQAERRIANVVLATAEQIEIEVAFSYVPNSGSPYRAYMFNNEGKLLGICSKGNFPALILSVDHFLYKYS